jgi:hypothetical protein
MQQTPQKAANFNAALRLRMADERFAGATLDAAQPNFRQQPIDMPQRG